MAGEFKIKLSEKFLRFLSYTKAVFEVLEGTTASGKTTVGGIKFMTKVAKSKKKFHIIAGLDLGTIEKNIVNAELGIVYVFGNRVKYYKGGHAGISMPHLVMPSQEGAKIIILLGYDNESRWKKALGGQYGCAMIDEINTASMAFVRQVMMRCDYVLATLNPDDPEKDIYKEFINRCRPLPEYENDMPQELLKMLNEEPEENWVHWYFSMDHNDGISDEKKNKIKRTYTPGSIEHLRYILGIRGKAEGIIFDNFNTKTNVVKIDDAKKLIKKASTKKDDEYFIQFSAGLDTSYSPNTNDTIAMSFIGITNTRKIYILDEKVLNNKISKITYSPSMITKEYTDFLEKNRNIYGFARDTFIDSADQATISEFKVYKNKIGSVYNFNNAWKQLKIIDRIQLQKGWIATNDFYVVDTCTSYLHELSVYSWSSTEKTIPEDANDHMINSVQYAFIPYKDKIGILPKGD